MYSVFIQIPFDDSVNFQSPEWLNIEKELSDVIGQPIGDTGMAMVSCEEGTGDNPCRDFWFDELSWEVVQVTRKFCQDNSYGFSAREHVTVYPAFSMECPKCGCEQMVEDGNPPMPAHELPTIVKCGECGCGFHPVRWGN